jgi:hypothetical protein
MILRRARSASAAFIAFSCIAAVETAPAGAASAQTLTFNLRPATYESMLRGGDPHPNHSALTIPAKATELKVLVGNLASGKIGTLTIPLSEIEP